MNDREKAIRLAEEYKRLEKRIPISSLSQITRIRARVAEIAAKMYDLGISLPKLILKRQNRIKNERDVENDQGLS